MDELVEKVARAIAKSDGLDFDEVCGKDTDPINGDCDSGTCIAAWSEDHEPDDSRNWYRKHAQAALSATPMQAMREENEEARTILSNLSSYLGAGMGDDKTTLAQFDGRIRWGIDHIGRVYRERAGAVVEECSKRPRTTWGEVKRAVLDDTALPTASPPPRAALAGGE